MRIMSLCDEGGEDKDWVPAAVSNELGSPEVEKGDDELVLLDDGVG